MRKILVTGGAGFIGRRIVPKLVALGHSVSVYDSMQLSSVKEFESVDDRIEIIRGDMRDYEKLSSAVAGNDQVLHLAAPSSMLMYLEKPIEATIVTYHGFLNLIEALRRHDINKFVFASTSAVYEGCPLPWHENLEAFPPDLKALSKLQNEQIAKQYGERYGITSVALRPLSVYGTGEYTKKGYANVTSLFIWAMLNGQRPIVWGDGAQTRDFIHVEDTSDLLIKILDWNYNAQKNGKMEIFNVGTGIETSFNEVISIINELLETNYNPIYVPIPIKIYSLRILGDMNKVHRVLRWHHKISIREGLKLGVERARRLSAESFSTYQKYALDIRSQEYLPLSPKVPVQ
jgi:nucleoside-diphosphate-sugar epimerase